MRRGVCHWPLHCNATESRDVGISDGDNEHLVRLFVHVRALSLLAYINASVVLDACGCSVIMMSDHVHRGVCVRGGATIACV